MAYQMSPEISLDLNGRKIFHGDWRDRCWCWCRESEVFIPKYGFFALVSCVEENGVFVGWSEESAPKNSEPFLRHTHFTCVCFGWSEVVSYDLNVRKWRKGRGELRETCFKTFFFFFGGACYMSELWNSKRGGMIFFVTIPVCLQSIRNPLARIK